MLPCSSGYSSQELLSWLKVYSQTHIGQCTLQSKMYYAGNLGWGLCCLWDVVGCDIKTCTLWRTKSLELSALVIYGTSKQKGTFCLWWPLSGSPKVCDTLECPCCSNATCKAFSESGIWHECIAYASRCPHTEALCSSVLFVGGDLLLWGEF